MSAVTVTKTINIALAGSPNVGKSTIFNLLTGLSQHVGNWPGKTVEQKTGFLQYGQYHLNIIDLPGTYSLTANSTEEQIARDFIIQEKPDVVIAVVNAANLERNLYLVAELLEICPRLIIALNMIDVAEQQGKKVSAEGLSHALGIPVIPVIATKNQGVDRLVKTAIELAETPLTKICKVGFEYEKDTARTIRRLSELFEDTDTAPYPRFWAALKMLEGDEQIHKILRGRMSAQVARNVEAFLKASEDMPVKIASQRFRWVEKMGHIVQQKRSVGQVSMTERFDRFATHPIYGLFVLIGILALVFLFVYSLGIPLQDLLENKIVIPLQEITNGAKLMPEILRSLLANGILGGVGIVLTFIPILFFFFIAFAFLEDVGYTARAAVVMDRFMHILGLHGKSCLPLILGFGCNVPAVLGARIIDSPRARLLTIILTPLIPCTGRMAVISVIAAAFFGVMAIWVSLGIIVFNLIVLILYGLVLNRFVVRGESGPLIMELPLYHLPKPKLIFLITWQNLKAFVRRAGTVILIVSLFIWLLSVIPHGNVDTSVLASIGRWLEPVGRLMGLNWQMLVALISSFVAKENTIATLGVLLSSGGGDLGQQLTGIISPVGAISFLIVQVLFIPCVATISAIYHETHGWKWPLLTILMQFVISFGLAIAAFQILQLVL